jgi:hypothetical protein
VVTPPADANAAPELTLEQLQAQLAEWKGHSRDWEAKAKANKEAKDKLDALELEKLSETERLQKELDTFKQGQAKAERQLLVASVAASTGVPAGLLQGETKEDLEAYAATLLEFKGVTPPPANDAAASGPQGTGPVTQVTQLTSIAGMSRAEILQADKDGRLKTLMGQ